jgi:Cu+-exporting ATPase
MHYVPESSREFLPNDPSFQADARRGIHYQSAPLYLLTLAVGGLLLLDVLASLTGAFAPAFYGYRFALLAAVLGGSRILYHTLDELSSGRIGAGLALTIAFAAAVWLGESMTAALVVFITLTGECVERYTIDRAHAAVRKVFDLYPPVARVVREGREQEIMLSELRPGDVVAVRPGERLPADGLVLDGQSQVDQSALTGESQPMEKAAGDEVFAGTQNTFSVFSVRQYSITQ